MQQINGISIEQALGYAVAIVGALVAALTFVYRSLMVAQTDRHKDVMQALELRYKEVMLVKDEQIADLRKAQEGNIARVIELSSTIRDKDQNTISMVMGVIHSNETTMTAHTHNSEKLTDSIESMHKAVTKMIELDEKRSERMELVQTGIEAILDEVTKRDNR